MDIFEFAMKKEKISENLYRQFSAEANNKGLKSIFDMLADEEAHHYAVIEQMKSKIPEKVSNTDVILDAKDVFKKMKESEDIFDFDESQAHVYEKARESEKASREYYLQKADEVEDHCQKGIFKKLANEEQKHYVLLDNIVEFVSRPEHWLENAEFCHLEEY